MRVERLRQQYADEARRQWEHWDAERNWQQNEKYSDWLSVGWGMFAQVMHDVRGEQEWEIVVAQPTKEYRENAKR